MNDQTDLQLLEAYAERRSEPAFSELVRRHVDFVYSAALRTVRDPQLAGDVTQDTFLALARNVQAIRERRALCGWLHQTARNLAAQVVRSDIRRRSREQEAAAMNELISASADVSWQQIAPHLDAGLEELNELEREALVLRYFQNRDFRAVGLALGVSDDTAQKRVSRAVERLREFLAKRGATVGAGGLVVVLSANAVQAAPIGLAATISTAAAAVVVGTTITTSATVTATKVIAMTTLQKAIVGTALVAAVGTGVYESRQATTYRTQVESLQQQQAPLTEQVRQLEQEKNEATKKLVALSEEVERLNRNTPELMKLRAEATRYRSASKEPAPAIGSGASATAPQGADATGDVSQLVQEASQLWQTGRYAQAIPKFEAAVKLDPGNSTAWNGLGWARLNSGKRAEAEQAFQKVIELDPDHPAALNALGQIYLSEKKYNEAEAQFLKASPKAPAAWYGLARLYLLQDKFDQAEKWSQAIIDSGQGDESSRAMLKAAKDKKVPDALRLMIEPQ